MRTPPSFSRPSAASLLLLGLLGLLVWGQCAFHLNESGSSQPAAPNLHVKMGVRVVRIDSLSTHGPDLLYVSVGLRNPGREPLELVSLDCGLSFDKEQLGFNLATTGRGAALPARAEQVLPLIIRPLKADDTHKATNFSLLRAAWQQGRLARHQAQLSIYYSYKPAGGTAEQANWRRRTVPLGR